MGQGRPSFYARAADGLRSLFGGVGGPRAEAGRVLTQVTVAPGNLSGEPVSHETVLSVTAAWAAVNAIATDVSSLPLELRRYGRGGSSTVVRGHPAARLFSRSPDGGSTTRVQWLRSMMFHRLVRGVAYSRIDWSGGYPTGLYVLDPEKVEPIRDAQGVVSYRVAGSPEPMPRDRILQFAGLGPDGMTAFSPTIQASQTLGLSRAAEGHAAAFFGNGAQPGGFFSLPGNPDPSKVDAFVANVKKLYGGRNRHSPGALTGGATYQKTGSTAAEAQLLELRSFQILEAARVWRISPHKLADYSKASYSSVEQSNLAHVTETLRPYCEEIEAALDLRLLTDAEVESGLHFAFDMSAYLRADTAAMSAWIRNLAASGIVRLDEARAMADLPPLPDGQGETLMVPLNTGPLDQVLAAPANPDSGKGPSNG